MVFQGFKFVGIKIKNQKFGKMLLELKGFLLSTSVTLWDDGLMVFSDQRCIELCQLEKNVIRWLYSLIRTQTVLWNVWRDVVVKHLLPGFHQFGPEIISTSDSVKPSPRFPFPAKINMSSSRFC